jgi:hypothetical protein
MKRGLIKWDWAELPPAAFQARLGRVRKLLAERDLPALLVYSDVWRSNQARFLTNFMPYWNRSLALIPAEAPPVLLCGLSPRVYPWIRSVTVFEEIRPASNLAGALAQFCADHAWKRLGVLDLAQVPHEVHAAIGSRVEMIDIPAREAISPDASELAMRKRAARLARETLEAELPKGIGIPDYQFVGRLERSLRLAGAEDLVLLLSTGESAPRPARGEVPGNEYSVSLALEYCGHWVRVTRPQCSESARETLRAMVAPALCVAPAVSAAGGSFLENLSGPYPWESMTTGAGNTFALQVEATIDGRRLFYGDTFHQTSTGAELL